MGQNAHKSLAERWDVWMPKQKKQHSPTMSCGNYIDRVDGAVFFRLGDSTMYFSNHKLIAIVTDGVMYRDGTETNGHIYRRIKVALDRQTVRAVKEVSTIELRDMAEVAIMTMARRLVDGKLGINA